MDDASVNSTSSLETSSAQERTYWLGFSAFSGIGPNRFGKLLAKFGTAHNAWSASLKDLQATIGKGFGQQFDSFRKDFLPIEYEKKLLSKKVWFVTLQDTEYPQLLKQIPNPPFVLYGVGDITCLNNSHPGKPKRIQDPDSGQARMTETPTIAVVGSRKTTQYGREVTISLVTGLSQAGLTIVSGLAMGVDAVAHKTAIENHAKTIAVLGCGVDCCYPTINQDIYNSILAHEGAIVSELPLSHPPSVGSFPSRNRIIAGLSAGVLVTEGAEDSGSLITAECAFKFNRKVFAVPGPINAHLSKGPLKLIRKGAKMVSDASEIIDELGIMNYELGKSTMGKKSSTGITGSTKDERAVLEILQNESLQFDEIAKRLKLDSSQTGTLLTMMEIKGMVKSLESGNYSLTS